MALFRTGDQALDPFLELGEADGRLAAAGRQQGRLVDEIGQVGADEARRDRRDLAQVDCFFERDEARMDLENLLAANQVGTVDDHLAVKAARPHQRLVERLRAIGRGQQDDSSVGVKPVHLHEQLVECLITLVVAAWPSRAASLANRVQLINEDEARRLGLGAGKKVPDP